LSITSLFQKRTTRQIRFETLPDRVQVYVVPSLLSSWQLDTAMLYLQYFASRFEHRDLSPARAPDPLERIFDNE
jgi:hypothetical protein